MFTSILRQRRVAALVALLGAAGAVAAYAVMASSATGTSAATSPALSGAFCNTGQTPLCMSITFNGQTFQGYQGSDHSVHLTLRPGAYSLTVNDNSRFHDFALRSCPGSTSSCDPSSNGAEQPITTVGDAPGLVTVPIHLDQGWYRLFCNASMGTMTHEDMGMYVDIQAVAFGPGSNLQGANLAGANLQGQNLRGANLQNVSGTGASFSGAQLQGANLDSGTYTNADFGGADLRGANLHGDDLTGATLANANLNGATLANANLTGATLADANLKGANLEGADLTNASLDGATLSGANLDSVTWSNTTCPDGTNSDGDGGTCLNNL